MKRVEAWDVVPGQTLRYTSYGKTLEGIVTATRSMPKDRVFITLTCGVVECGRSAVFELIEVT